MRTASHFAATLATTDAERANPWLLLNRRFDDGAVPAIADATSLQYVLHAAVGDEITIDIGGTTRLVLSDSSRRWATACCRARF